MPLIVLLVVLIVVGVLMWAVNTLAAPYMWPPMLKLFNVVALVAVVVYVLFWFLGFFGISLGNIMNEGAFPHR
jgi:hypothetical protein